jgi:predicted RNA-binding protein with PUA domain
MTKPIAILDLRPGDKVILVAKYDGGETRYEIVVREFGHVHLQEEEG